MKIFAALGTKEGRIDHPGPRPTIKKGLGCFDQAAQKIAACVWESKKWALLISNTICKSWFTVAVS